MSEAISPQKSTARERWAWYLYDFGNSAYAAVVLLAVYSAYFQGEVVGGAEGSRLWGIAVGIAMLTVAVTSPILGSIADHSGSKKKFLGFFTFVACLFTSLLFFVRSGDVVMGMVFFVVAEIGYRSAQVFYNSLLPEIAGPDDIGRISGNAWAIGSAGGIVCLVLVLALIMLVGGDTVVRISFFITAAFFALSALPIFFWLRERAQPRPLPEGKNYLTYAFGRIAKTAKSVRHYREFIKFIVAFLIYNDGILMTLDFAAIFGAVLFGIEQEGLIIFMIVVQVFSVLGAYVGGELADRIGAKQTTIASLFLMTGAVTVLFWNQTILGFYILGSVAGFALTVVQSVSRTMVGMFAPEGRSAEFYGFFAVAGRTSSFIGPTIFGILAAEATQWYIANRALTVEMAEQMGHRIAIWSIVAFLLAGTLALWAVNEQAGRRAAKLAAEHEMGAAPAAAR